MEQLTISMAIFNSYVKLPEGNQSSYSMDWFVWENLKTGNQSDFPMKYGAFL